MPPADDIDDLWRKLAHADAGIAELRGVVADRLDPWSYLRHVLSDLPARRAGAGQGDLLPDAWGKSRGETHRRVG